MGPSGGWSEFRKGELPLDAFPMWVSVFPVWFQYLLGHFPVMPVPLPVPSGARFSEIGGDFRPQLWHFEAAAACEVNRISQPLHTGFFGLCFWRQCAPRSLVCLVGDLVLFPLCEDPIHDV
jgi:hypothetical protein